VRVAVAADGRYAVDGVLVDGRRVEALQAALATAARGRADAVVIVSADALAAHQTVVNVLDAARRAGLSRLTFAAQSAGTAPR
jgi:biopolymer transport protein ExbD